MSRERTLDDVRGEIDTIDDTIQDLLIRRTELVEEVRSIKRDWRVKIQPSREAEIIYRLVQRHHGPFPKRDLAAIWRILICATLSFEGPFSVSVYTPPAGKGCWDLARDHFGPCTAMSRHGSVRSVIEAVHRQDATVGVLPLPRHDDADPWWRHIVTSTQDAPRIIARLPFVNFSAGGAGSDEALVICPITVAPTGHDRSLFAIECRQRIGLDQLTQILHDAEFTPTFATVWKEHEAPADWLHLAEVDDYLAANDPRLNVLEQALGRSLNRIVLLGGYALPVPSDLLGGSRAAANAIGAGSHTLGGGAAAP
jgi:chorismate mutase/prephenate dehydratase